MQQRKALALLSGGLDSTLAVKMMLDMGITVEAINFTSSFCNCTSKNAGCKSEAVRVAQEFNIPIKVVHKGIDYLEVIRNPKHGYGKGINPCVDCRIYLLRKAKEYMSECGADFVITGEVLGQRPMSQRRDSLRVIERESGLEGLLLRPLSAQHFAPTIPEKEGWVDREKLLAIKGRSRKELFDLAEEIDVANYPCPAGGCLLTELSFVPKIKDMFKHSDEQLDQRDFRLLKIGRHFRLGERTKMILGRDESDNNQLENIRTQSEAALTWMDGNTPVGIIIGNQEFDKQLASKILLRYTKAAVAENCRISLRQNGAEIELLVSNSMTPSDVEKYIIA